MNDWTVTWTESAGLLVAAEFWPCCVCWPESGWEMPTTTAWAGWVGRLTVVLPGRGLAVCMGQSERREGGGNELTWTVCADVTVVEVVVAVWEAIWAVLALLAWILSARLAAT